MDYVGKQVLHKGKYGEGTIISHDSGGYIFVKFYSSGEERIFPFPKCFQTHLQILDDKEAAAAVEKELSLKAHAEKAEADLKKEKTAEIIWESKSGAGMSSGATVHMPTYHSVTAFCTEQKTLLSQEIAYLKKTGGKKTKLINFSSLLFFISTTISYRHYVPRIPYFTRIF